MNILALQSDYEENRSSNDSNSDLYQRYRQYHRYRHTFRALQYHHIRRRLWNQSRMTNNNNYYILPQNELNMNHQINIQQTLSDHNHDENNLTLNNLVNLHHSNNDQNHIKLKVVSPKLKHATNGRLDQLQDFKAAFALIPLRLTSLDPFKQKINKKIMKNQNNNNKKIVISAIDATQNFLSQLSSDLHLIILNMLTGIGNVRTMALYNSLRSTLHQFDMERVRNCSVYKCQALFVERYRQNLFDEKYKALQQPALTRALSTEPRNLFEFQQDRKAKVLKKQSSNNYQYQDDDDQKSISM